jgi:galactonate dehydratase
LAFCEGYVKQPLKIANGYLELPTAVGLGIKLEEEKIADKIDHD